MPVPGTSAGVTGASAPRVYDYLTGGHENYAADRDLAGAMMDPDRGGYPGLRDLACENRSFVLKAVRWVAAMRGTGQFIDAGCGLPAVPAVHAEARGAVPPAVTAVTAYVDRDPEVVAHCRAAYAGEPGVAVIEADVSDPAGLLASPELRKAVDLGRPACVILGATLSAMGPDEARKTVAGFAGVLAPGSAVIISCATFGDQALAERMAALFGAAGEWHNHGLEDVASFFEAGGLQPVRGKVGSVRTWPLLPSGNGRETAVIGGIGLKG